MILVLIVRVEPASAQDAPTLLPTKLDFVATEAPTTCNDRAEFRWLLARWVPLTVLTNDAARRLSVRIQRTKGGGKRVDVALIDTDGAMLVDDHKTYPAQIECHKVLSDTAHVAAWLLGALEPAPPREPPTCPVPLPPQVPQPCPRYPLAPAVAMRQSPSTRPVSPFAILGLGVFYATALLPEPTLGPRVSLGFVPWPSFPHARLEFDGGWTTQSVRMSATHESTRVYAMPFVGSICYAPQVIRLCGGLSTQFFYSKFNPADSKDDPLRIALAASLRVGTEWPVYGPFSIRVDLFGWVRFDERISGAAMRTLAALDPVVAGAALMGTWALH